MVDAIGLETEFTLETTRKRVKEKLSELKTPAFHLLDLKFLNIMNSEMEDKTCILHVPLNSKAYFWGPGSFWNTPKKHNL